MELISWLSHLFQGGAAAYKIDCRECARHIPPLQTMVAKKRLMATNSSSVPSYQKRKKPTSLSSRCGLLFPVGRVGRYMRHVIRANRFSLNASIYLTAALQMLCEEALFVATEQTRVGGRKVIKPEDIMEAVQNDVELHSLAGLNVDFYCGDIYQRAESRRKARKSKQKTN